MGIIATGTTEMINNAECDLIDYFKSSKLKTKCANENQGGGGNPNAIELYIFAQEKDADRFDGLLNPTPLFSFNAINLN